MRLNISAIQEFDLCPQLFHYKWHDQKGMDKPSQAMQDGTYAHAVLAHMLLTNEPPETFDGFNARSHVKYATASERALNAALRLWWEKYQLHRPWDEVIAAEEPLALKRPWGELVGTPDTVVRAFGKLWHVQHKRIGQSISPQQKIKLVEVSLHEQAYGWMIEEKYPGEEYGGTLLNLVRHFSEKRMRETPDQALFIAFLGAQRERMERALKNIDKRAYEMLQTLESDEAPYRNSQSCCGAFHNSECDYYGPCWRGVDIQTSGEYIHINPLSRYTLEEGSN